VDYRRCSCGDVDHFADYHLAEEKERRSKGTYINNNEDGSAKRTAIFLIVRFSLIKPPAVRVVGMPFALAIRPLPFVNPEIRLALREKESLPF
jgi:hypothetical protein